MSLDFVKRTNLFITPNAERVLIRYFAPGNPLRITRVLARVMSLKDELVKQMLEQVLNKFGDRHYQIKHNFIKHFESVRQYMLTDIEPDEDRKLLIGAYFTSEYALESAAIFNPSMVPHFDQSGLKKGETRFILSLRATGEGHISSVEFRTGIITKNHQVIIEEPGPFVTYPERIANPIYEKLSFMRKLYEIGIDNEYSQQVLANLPPNFSLEQLINSINYQVKKEPLKSARFEITIEKMKWLAESNHEVQFEPSLPLGERVIFPYISNEKKGIEDARFVRYEEDGTYKYYATYTAYDGNNFLPQLIETEDFNYFRFITLNGKAVQNKGMALFPRKINGKYCMLSRQDNENIYIMYSDNIHFWHETTLIMKPSYPWEFVQLGNCGSPIETEKGWLVLTHGVGPMRRYCIGAILLDKDDPGKIIGRLESPLLEPDENEREGYVPNVVYTCGAMVHQGKLVLPYAMSDYATTFAVVDVDLLLDSMLNNKNI